MKNTTTGLLNMRTIIRKQLRWTMLIVVAALALAACATPQPRIEVAPPSQDLGEVPQQILELTYTVRNTGDSPLRIEKISTSCDCTEATVDRDVLPSGETTMLRVKLDPTEDNLYGKVMRVIYLRSNDPATPEAQVDFRANIRKP